ncbi:hypothetical protein BCR42DRAFT_391723 [Absidia repens]|uniref:Uncharacterized protein n=1 Tax=Absidia repens TaxID=90262 RepID=A0A1X2IHU3_9FUNG|nr:hypothetical protein BCR42DRAFT_391723 [Absidia repens]
MTGTFNLFFYDCMPRIPFLQPKANEFPLYGPNDEIPIFIALIMEFQRFRSSIDTSGPAWDGQKFEKLCQGGLLADGISGVFSDLATFNQNNGIIAVKRPMIGGMTTFISASAATSGFHVHDYLDWTRRDRVIVAAPLSLALGFSMALDWFKYVLSTSSNTAFQGFLSAFETVVCTEYIMAANLYQVAVTAVDLALAISGSK